MHAAWRFAATAAALFLASVPAAAATVTLPDGKQETLEAGREVTGPAVVASADGKDVIRLRPGAVLRYLGEQKDEGDGKGGSAEGFFLKSGAADADLGFWTRLATPAFWAFPESRGKRASFHAATLPGGKGYARGAKGSGLVRLLVDSEENGSREVHLGAGQGVLVAREPGGLRFSTDADSDWTGGVLRVLAPLGKGRLLDVYVPKATEGALLRIGDGALLLADGLGSWRGGRIRFVTTVGGNPSSEGALGPGSGAAIDPATGAFAAGSEGAGAAAAPLRLLPRAGTAAGGVLRPSEGASILIRAIRMETGDRGPRARFVLRNDGPALDRLSGEAAFLFPTEAGSAAPFAAAFVPFESAGWQPGEERSITFDSPAGSARMPLDVMLLASRGSEPPSPAAREDLSGVRRRGTLLFGRRVEVVDLGTDLFADKPWIELTLEDADPAGTEAPLGELRYELGFWRDGKPVPSGSFTGVLKGPGRSGERVVLRIEGLPGDDALAGAKPVLTLSR